ncbi:MAG: 2-amino-4-hydroxy-6-hydroxymethyldihydropteridine diphosphokinase [Myxococcota bacterium]|nr:2-amino-4-hydroxy-6-hydroxymethyldihydropteridine diphosphokinase [Myxococcota bacterium]
MFKQYAWIGLGGNLDKTPEILLSARRALQSLSAHAIVCSPIYRSAPWGVREQNPFLNQVVAMVPSETPDELMDRLLQIEVDHGRIRAGEMRWGPRHLDLDLLDWPTFQANTVVQLPHPRLHLRRFVLQPWFDLAPTHIPMGFGRSIEQLLRACVDTGACERTMLFSAL